jgi:hypothetical protein
MKKLIAGLCAVAFALAISAVPVLADSNPSTTGTGQPSQSCQEQTSSPPGFNTAGFAHAALVYAGSPQSPTISNNANAHAVAQYDVACYQVSH